MTDDRQTDDNDAKGALQGLQFTAWL